MMPPAVTVLWIILLVVAALAVPVVVYLLHRTWSASRSIARYMTEMREAGEGIAANTAHITALGNTQTTAGALLATAGDIDEHAATIESVLTDRATFYK